MDILQSCGLNRGVLGWERKLNWAIQRLKGRALISLLMRIAWSAYIYYVWKKWNSRIHTHKIESSEQVVMHIKEVIRFHFAKLRNIRTDSVNILLT